MLKLIFHVKNNKSFLFNKTKRNILKIQKFPKFEDDHTFELCFCLIAENLHTLKKSSKTNFQIFLQNCLSHGQWFLISFAQVWSH